LRIERLRAERRIGTVANSRARRIAETAAMAAENQRANPWVPKDKR
jgi:hypothetical protein